MKVFTQVIFVILALCLVPEISAQNKKRDAKAIVIVKNLSVSKFDKRLPPTPFSKWFGSKVGNSRSIEWEVNDCGEQDGSGRQKDFPICVQGLGMTKDNLEITVSMVVGSNKRGIVGKAIVWGIWIRPRDKEVKEVRKLYNLGKEIARLRN